MMKIKIILTCLALTVCSGCAVVSSLGTPTSHEKKIPAEFNLADYDSGKVAVIITSNADNEQGNRIRNYLSKAVATNLAAREIVSPLNIISYNTIYNVSPTPVPNNDAIVTRIAASTEAKTVIKVEIKKYKLEKLSTTEYYEGSLSVSSSILDTASGQSLWPGAGFGKEVIVSFDVESKGYEAASKRLANAAAHCITRYLYDCPLNNFKIYEESISIE